MSMKHGGKENEKQGGKITPNLVNLCLDGGSLGLVALLGDLGQLLLLL